MIVGLHDLTFQLSHFDNIVIDKHSFSDYFDSVILFLFIFVLLKLGQINFTESSTSQEKFTRNFTKHKICNIFIFFTANWLNRFFKLVFIIIFYESLNLGCFANSKHRLFLNKTFNVFTKCSHGFLFFHKKQSILLYS